MKKTANKLTAGDVVQSGELVVSAKKSGHFQNVKMLVVLKNPTTGKTRVATWGYYSTIFMKSEVVTPKISQFIRLVNGSSVMAVIGDIQWSKEHGVWAGRDVDTDDAWLFWDVSGDIAVSYKRAA